MKEIVTTIQIAMDLPFELSYSRPLNYAQVGIIRPEIYKFTNACGASCVSPLQRNYHASYYTS